MGVHEFKFKFELSPYLLFHDPVSSVRCSRSTADEGSCSNSGQPETSPDCRMAPRSAQDSAGDRTRCSRSVSRPVRVSKTSSGQAAPQTASGRRRLSRSTVHRVSTDSEIYEGSENIDLMNIVLDL